MTTSCAMMKNTNTNTIDTDFDSVCKFVNNKVVTPFVVNASNGDKIAYVLTTNTNHDKPIKTIRKHLKCNTCRNFMRELSTYYFHTGSVFKNVKEEEYKKLAKLGSFKRKSVKLNQEKPAVTLITNKKYGFQQLGGFQHFCIKPTEICNLKAFTETEYEWFFNQKLDAMFNLLEGYGDDIIGSLDILINNLKHTIYADKMESACNWFRTTMKKWVNARTIIDEYKVAIEALVSAPLSAGEGNDFIEITHLSVVRDNVISALEVCDSISELTSLLNARFNPLKYQVSTTEPSENELKKGIKILEDMEFENMKLMSLKNLRNKYGGRIIPIKNKNNALSALKDKLKTEKTKTKTKSTKAGGFMSRCKKLAIESMTKLSKLENLDGLEYYIDQPRWMNKFRQFRDGSTPCSLTEYPDSAVDKNGKSIFTHPHLWSFYNNLWAKEFKMKTGWHKVTAIHFMDRNVFIGIKGFKYKVDEDGIAKLLGNSYHTNMLVPAYNRKLAKAFTFLNSTTTMNVPSGVPTAVGIGDSCTSRELKKLYKVSGHRFRLDGKEFTIKYM